MRFRTVRMLRWQASIRSIVSCKGLQHGKSQPMSSILSGYNESIAAQLPRHVFGSYPMGWFGAYDHVGDATWSMRTAFNFHSAQVPPYQSNSQWGILCNPCAVPMTWTGGGRAQFSLAALHDSAPTTSSHIAKKPFLPTRRLLELYYQNILMTPGMCTSLQLYRSSSNACSVLPRCFGILRRQSAETASPPPCLTHCGCLSIEYPSNKHNGHP